MSSRAVRLGVSASAPVLEPALDSRCAGMLAARALTYGLVRMNTEGLLGDLSRAVGDAPGLRGRSTIATSPTGSPATGS
ncbi:hypothetical protein [Nannocystis pusilla]|uniref:hypothetical protein n=1 Tax=Nannocystis pusilla TaxID=889268 RepID=UPI003B773C14